MGGTLMAETTMSLPFAIDPYGRVTSTQDQAKIWADRVRSVIGTSVTERVMRGGCGTRVSYTVFDGEHTAAQEIKTEVESAFNSQLPLLTLNSVTSTFDQYSNNTTIVVIYALPNTQIVTTSIAVAYVDSSGAIYEENL